MRAGTSIRPERKGGGRAAHSPRLLEGPTLAAVAHFETLRLGWERVRSNKGGHGGDGVSIQAFEADVDARLERLGKTILAGTYRPSLLRRVSIPKADGRTRTLAIPAVVDRVAQSALLAVLLPVVDPRMSDSSWAYRPRRGVRDAISEAEALFKEGYTWSVDADITRYFDRVPHRRLIDELTIWIDDERIVQLIALWLKSFDWRGTGIAQGAPISPLLANLYLHPVDRQLVAAGFPLVRYADDLIVLAKTQEQARDALSLLRELLTARGLSLNKAKSAIRPPDQTFRFLGQDIRANKDDEHFGSPARER